MQNTPTRLHWLVLASSMAAACVVYGAVIASIFSGGMAPAPAEAPVPRPLFWTAATALLAASMVWTHVRLRGPIRRASRALPPGELMGPAEFQLRSIVSLALAESACLAGFVQTILFRTSLADYVPFAVAAVLVIVLDAIPAGLAYWSAWETRPDGGAERRPTG